MKALMIIMMLMIMMIVLMMMLLLMMMIMMVMRERDTNCRQVRQRIGETASKSRIRAAMAPFDATAASHKLAKKEPHQPVKPERDGQWGKREEGEPEPSSPVLGEAPPTLLPTANMQPRG